ncbi:hypothetical protein K502DRAFT_353740 [Neoconidiobolus thromboides FSU 785]|nr:hypothetical protein K502DRAFT_353740 [Neoconidiobolus thromboides FSU 785]
MFEKLREYLILPDWLHLIILSKIYRNVYLTYIYRLYKKIQRLLFGKSSIELILENEMDQNQEKLTSISLMLLDISIYYSKQLLMEHKKLEIEDCEVGGIIENVVTKKEFDRSDPSFDIKVQRLKFGITNIQKCRRLSIKINQMAATKYDKENKKHEFELIKLWKLLKPEEELSNRKSKQWQSIGFQGDDPATDFRGMGILALKDLTYFSEKYTSLAQKILSDSQHMVSWYSFALVSIHITAFTLELLRTRLLLFQFYGFGIHINTYHEVYCYLFQRFNEYWFQPRDTQITVMDFENIFQMYKLMIAKELLRYRTFKPIKNHLRVKSD